MTHIAPPELNKTLGEKARYELYKDTTYCFEQIMKTESHKTAAAWSLTSYPMNHSRKMSKT